MLTNLTRILKFGFQNFSRNGLVSFVTIVTLTLMLIVFAGLVMFIATGQQLLTIFQDKIDIAVYFKDTVPEDDILTIKSSVEKLAEVKSTDYTSRDKALEIFTEKHKDDSVIVQALHELGDNPLLASLNIKATAPSHYESIVAYLNADALKDKVEKITYTQNSDVIHKIVAIIETTKLLGWAAVLFLGIIAALVTMNTIRLVIYSNRNEIEIARLVGASNSLIQGPYFITALIYGIIATLLSLLVCWPLIYFLSPYLNNVAPEIQLYKIFLSNLSSIFGYMLIAGVALAVFSSNWAVKKYAKI